VNRRARNPDGEGCADDGRERETAAKGEENGEKEENRRDDPPEDPPGILFEERVVARLVGVEPQKDQERRQRHRGNEPAEGRKAAANGGADRDDGDGNCKLQDERHADLPEKRLERTYLPW
jgi:hypothetical protein